MKRADLYLIKSFQFSLLSFLPLPFLPSPFRSPFPPPLRSPFSPLFPPRPSSSPSIIPPTSPNQLIRPSTTSRKPPAMRSTISLSVPPRCHPPLTSQSPAFLGFRRNCPLRSVQPDTEPEEERGRPRESNRSGRYSTSVSVPVSSSSKALRLAPSGPAECRRFSTSGSESWKSRVRARGPGDRLMLRRCWWRAFDDSGDRGVKPTDRWRGPSNRSPSEASEGGCMRCLKRPHTLLGLTSSVPVLAVAVHLRCDYPRPGSDAPS